MARFTYESRHNFLEVDSNDNIKPLFTDAQRYYLTSRILQTTPYAPPADPRKPRLQVRPRYSQMYWKKKKKEERRRKTRKQGCFVSSCRIVYIPSPPLYRSLSLTDRSMSACLSLDIALWAAGPSSLIDSSLSPPLSQRRYICLHLCIPLAIFTMPLFLLH